MAKVVVIFEDDKGGVRVSLQPHLDRLVAAEAAGEDTQAMRYAAKAVNAVMPSGAKADPKGLWVPGQRGN